MSDDSQNRQSRGPGKRHKHLADTAEQLQRRRTQLWRCLGRVRRVGRVGDGSREAHAASPIRIRSRMR